MRVTLAILASIAFLAGCGTDKGAIVQQGTSNAATVAVINTTGKIEAYPPAASEPKNQYTFSATPQDGPAIKTYTGFDIASKTLTACPVVDANSSHSSVTLKPFLCPPAPHGRVDYLVRIPKEAHAFLATATGDIHVSDVDGPVDASAINGDIKIQIPSYANARTINGNVSVTFGDVNWPGTLHFSSDRGDVEVYVPAVANAHVDLHTDHGTVYTDFDLHGTAQGTAETIVGNIGSGGNRSVVVRVKNGSVRLLKLVPQM
ncbi:MAG: hypothetical protein NVSMB31_18640 [Vulcanimicrobiaceae bacterium]